MSKHLITVTLTFSHEGTRDEARAIGASASGYLSDMLLQQELLDVDPDATFEVENVDNDDE